MFNQKLMASAVIGGKPAHHGRQRSDLSYSLVPGLIVEYLQAVELADALPGLLGGRGS